eukprot:365001-Chlamydomonas_euryale.AAC.7
MGVGGTARKGAHNVRRGDTSKTWAAHAYSCTSRRCPAAASLPTLQPSSQVCFQWHFPHPCFHTRCADRPPAHKVSCQHARADPAAEGADSAEGT